MRLWSAVTQSQKAWPRDEEDRIILFKLPPLVNLDTPAEAASDTKSNDKSAAAKTFPSTSISNLPAEVIHNIVAFLHPIDRVCLGLSSKRLASRVLSAPRLSPNTSPNTWGWFNRTDNTYLAPDRYTLILRLAHGWVNKDRWRYCWTCNKIVTRDPQYFETRLRRTKKPRWSTRLNVEQEVWTEWTKDQRYDHLIRMWSLDRGEDSSSLFCDLCRSTQTAEPARHPSQCPKCLEADLTYKFKPNRWPQRRRILEEIAWIVILGPVFVAIVVLTLLEKCFPTWPFLVKLKAEGLI
ncbi:hypothetical protein B0A52_04436 [Exophiala mesophila]|uniref:F-box domain-containing protein n=1 Tax=Exophiala mesophila TaxID=212818 RepID=A0A438N9D9_EXOME|nr:hypothetical protein B0A52_04436 [Exophiala mesophila]